MCVNLANYAINCVVFQENLHSWHKFYTTASRDGRDKSQLCTEPSYNTLINDNAQIIISILAFKESGRTISYTVTQSRRIYRP